MKKIGIFYGSDTGNTKNIAKIIKKKLNLNKLNLHDIAISKKEDFKKYDFIILGISTWYYGEVQSDWNNFIPELKKINLEKKIIAFFGCGDQEDYSEYFCDAIGIIYNIIKINKFKLIGNWPIKNYKFIKSKSLINKNNFIGLIIDEDRQPEFTKKRINNWIKKIKKELKTC